MGEKRFERELHFDGSTRARGRNGYFSLRHGKVTLHTSQDVSCVWLDLKSKHKGKLPPIYLRFTTASELRILGQALLDAAGALDPAGAAPKYLSEKKPTPPDLICPECGAEDVFGLAIDETSYYRVLELSTKRVRAKHQDTETAASGDPLGSVRLMCTSCDTYFEMPDDYETQG